MSSNLGGEEGGNTPLMLIKYVQHKAQRRFELGVCLVH